MIGLAQLGEVVPVVDGRWSPRYTPAVDSAGAGPLVRCFSSTAPSTRMTRDYLTEMLCSYWFAPPVALWRAIELRTVARHRVARPILDLGCGDGLIGRAVADAPASVDVGFDPWMEQLRRALRSGVYRHVDCAAGEAMPYRSASFASVFSNSVLEHITDPQPVVGEAARVLTAGGRFIFTVPSHHFRRLLDGYARRAPKGDEPGAEAYADAVDAALSHRHYHSPDEWRDILHLAGLALERIEYYVPERAMHLWDRMNRRFGVYRRRSAWSMLASPRLQGLGHQRALRARIVRRFAAAWRQAYETDVPDGQVGGGLLVCACKQRSG